MLSCVTVFLFLKTNNVQNCHVQKDENDLVAFWNFLILKLNIQQVNFTQFDIFTTNYPRKDQTINLLRVNFCRIITLNLSPFEEMSKLMPLKHSLFLFLFIWISKIVRAQ